MRCCGGISCFNELRQQLAAPDGDPLAGTGTMPDGDLQVHPGKLDFTAAVGTDAPVTLTLFNPHPSERLAFKVSSLPTCLLSADTPPIPSQEMQHCGTAECPPCHGRVCFPMRLDTCTTAGAHVGVRRPRTDQIRLPSCPLRSVTTLVKPGIAEPRHAGSSPDRLSWLSWAGRGLGPRMGLGKWRWLL